MSISSFRISLIAVLMAAIAPLAIAQNETGPVEECISRISHTAEQAIETNQHIARRTIEAIRQLDSEDRPTPLIIATGIVGTETIDRRSHAAIERVSTIAQECIAVLRENDAQRAAILAVRRASDRARGMISASASRANHAINRAVHHALNN